MATSSYKLADGTRRWLFIFDPPPGPEGKRRRMLKRGFATQLDAAAEIEARKRLTSDDRSKALDGTVAAELRAFLQAAENNMEVTSIGWYPSMLESYVIPYIGLVPVHRVDATMINRLYRALLKRGRTRRK